MWREGESITQAITNAGPGDAIIVGPGRYGDLDRNGTPGDSPGEEIPSPGCGCMLAINKPVTVTSSDGAAVTFIDARTANVDKNVLVITNGGGLGKPGKGFTVTSTHTGGSSGIVIDSSAVAIRGNQAIAFSNATGAGIETVDSAGVVLIEANQTTGWSVGINTRGANKTVRKNVASGNFYGIIVAATSTATGNVVVANDHLGILVSDDAGVFGNAVIGNVGGISNKPFGGGPALIYFGAARKNDIFGNSSCGFLNDGVFRLEFIDNYWGSASGPGADPADGPCDSNGGLTTVVPFATKPIKVKAPIKP